MFLQSNTMSTPSYVYMNLENDDNIYMDLDEPVSSVQIILYRINVDHVLPFVELVVDTQQEFPLCEMTDLYPSSRPSFTNWTNQVRNQCFNFIETRIFSFSSNELSNLPKFKGFYLENNEGGGGKKEDSICYAFYDATHVEKPFSSSFQWSILNRVPRVPRDWSFFQLNMVQNNVVKEIKTRPILVYGSNNQYIRQERQPFGYCFFLKEQSDSEFRHPHWLFLPDMSKIFYIQKNEIQNIATTVLDKYDFSEEICIQYTEHQNTTWCIKNILSFVPVPIPEMDESKPETANNANTGSTYSRLFGNNWENSS